MKEFNFSSNFHNWSSFEKWKQLGLKSPTYIKNVGQWKRSGSIISKFVHFSPRNSPTFPWFRPFIANVNSNFHNWLKFWKVAAIRLKNHLCTWKMWDNAKDQVQLSWNLSILEQLFPRFLAYVNSNFPNWLKCWKVVASRLKNYLCTSKMWDNAKDQVQLSWNLSILVHKFKFSQLTQILKSGINSA